MPSRDRKKILAVDDQAVNLDVYETLLGDRYHLVTATRGTEALDVAARFRPDLILLDVNMPGWSGYETCRRLRADASHRFCKILMVSAERSAEDRLKGYEAGADDYVTKPFEDDELLAKVEVFLRLKFAEEVDRLKGDVLTLLCHETRTPLNVLITPAEILASEDEIKPERRREWGKMILDGMHDLHRLLEKVMLLSQFKSGKPDVARSRCSVDAMVSTAIADTSGAAAASHVSVDYVPTDLEVLGHVEYLGIVLRSLIDNAVRFSEPGGSVDVRGRREGASVVIDVVDHGCGIEPDQIARVFEEFTTSHDVLHHSSGHGLSLALSRAIVEELGGTIDVRSQPGVETVFTIALPAEAATPASRPPE